MAYREQKRGSQARQKLKAAAFETLNDGLTDLLNEQLPGPRWQGLRLVATGSTTLRLPPCLENREEFGVQTDSGGQPYVLARALGLFAARSKLMIKTVLGRFDDAGRALLAALLPHLASLPPPCIGSWPCCSDAVAAWSGTHQALRQVGILVTVLDQALAALDMLIAQVDQQLDTLLNSQEGLAKEARRLETILYPIKIG